MSEFIDLVNLVKIYKTPKGDAVIVDGFNLKMNQGEFVSIIGHSGCGKTTVLSMTAGLLEKSGGNVVVDKKEVAGPGPDRAVVFQAPNLLPWMSTLNNVMLGVNQVYPHASKKERHQICEYFLNIVGLGDSMHKMPNELSGGMQQRVGIARALALKPKMLLLDEPFGKLDSLTRMDLQDILIKILDKNQMTTMMVTHDVDEAIYLSDRIVMMTNGPAAKVGEILEIPFEKPRTRSEILEDPRYYELRGRLLSFLEEQDHKKKEFKPKAKIEKPADEPDDNSEIKKSA